MKTVKGDVFEANSFLANLTESDSLELQLVSSLREKNGITLLGSSELTSKSENLPYKFLPDSTGIRVNAFGHAYQQSFAMFCQLLALKKELKGAKVCILLSPGWFETEGTNIEAFLEFVRPNFLSKIIKDQSISTKYKNQITSFLTKNEALIENPNASIDYFLNKKKYQEIPYLNAFFHERFNEFPKIEYDSKFKKNFLNENRKEVNWERNKALAQTKFLAASKSNEIFVSDVYFNKHLKQKDGSFKGGKYLCLAKEKSQELKDFKLLVDLLKQEKCNVSFVIQTLNPYYYDNLESFNPVLNEIKYVLNQEKIPYLNLYSTTKKDYKVGILDDVMHLGDLGWLEVNQFLYHTYHEK